MAIFKSKIGNFINKIIRKIFFREMSIEEYNKINNIEYNKDSKSPDKNLQGGGVACGYKRY